MYFILFLFIKKFYFFSERGKGGGKRERRTDVQEKHSGVPRAPPAGDPGPDPGVGAPDTCVRRPALGPLSRTSQGRTRGLESRGLF